jgi:hypothetical protein
MEEINRFVILAQSDRFTVTELCAQFGIGRKTGYKHLERYAATGLKDVAPNLTGQVERSDISPVSGGLGPLSVRVPAPSDYRLP